MSSGPPSSSVRSIRSGAPAADTTPLPALLAISTGEDTVATFGRGWPDGAEGGMGSGVVVDGVAVDEVAAGGEIDVSAATFPSSVTAAA